MSGKCEECKWWVRIGIADAERDFGECRRRAPFITQENGVEFPQVFNDTFCGDFEARGEDIEADILTEHSKSTAPFIAARKKKVVL